MNKIDFDKFKTPRDEQEFIEICYQVLREFGMDGEKVSISFNEELKYNTYGREAYDKEEHKFYLEFNPVLFNHDKEDIVDTIYHEVLHAYISLLYPNEDYENKNHLGKFKYIGNKIGLDFDY